MSISAEPSIKVHLDDGVARLTINRPPLNILDLETILALEAALKNFADDDLTGIIVIQGSGTRAFCAGVDVRAHTSDQVERILGAFHSVFHRFWNLNQVTVAAIRGHCLGGGFELAMACDLAIATQDARFGQPEIELGCFAPVAAAVLPAAIGWKRAAELLLLGKIITADEALRLGLINSAVPGEDLNSVVEEWVTGLRSKSRTALKLCKEAMRAALGVDQHAALKRSEYVYLRRLVGTEDMDEGIRAFIEKRPPSWKHK